eukprot:m.14202 g.14202  ORF g.14202 m.14202 type:complete len:197 (-) comp5035_c0_seq2:213-803(-)
MPCILLRRFAMLLVAQANGERVFFDSDIANLSDLAACLRELRRVVKPGGTIACYDWCMTNIYDESLETHRVCKREIEDGAGIPDLRTFAEVDAAARQAGITVYAGTDKAVADASKRDTPWHYELTPTYNPFSLRFQYNPFGKAVLHFLLQVIEFIGLAPAGSCEVSKTLLISAKGLADGGDLGVFTPAYFWAGKFN